MGAIAGIIGPHTPSNQAVLQRMVRALQSRAPDGLQLWSSPTPPGQCGCMMAVLKSRTAEPRHTAQIGSCPNNPERTVGIDATIFSYSSYSSSCLNCHPECPDVLRVACAGAAGLKSLRGMFSVALWDESTGQLTLARDHMGLRALYYCVNPDPGTNPGWTVAFASELRALLASELLARPRVDPVGLASLVWNGLVYGPATIVKGIGVLLPGEMRTLDRGGNLVQRGFFWKLPAPVAKRSKDDSAIGEAIHQVVRLQVQSPQPVGYFLSGGIDSASLTNLSHRLVGGSLHTFCMGLDDPSMDETGAAREISKAIGTTHHEIHMTEQRMIDGLESAMASLDQPTFEGINLYFMALAFAEAGVHVAIGGLGGDSLYGGLPVMKRVPQLWRYARMSRALPMPLRMAAARVARGWLDRSGGHEILPNQSGWAKLPDFVGAGTDLVALIQLNNAIFLPEFQREMLLQPPGEGEFWYGLPVAARDWMCEEIEGHTTMSAVAMADTRAAPGERLLREHDSIFAACGVEARSPLLDPTLVEELNRLEDAVKYQPVEYKPLLRKYGLEGLDRRLFDRPKLGFELPFERWMRGRLGERVGRTLCDGQLAAAVGLNGDAVGRMWKAYQARQAGLYWTRPWAIYSLMDWCRRHNVYL